MSLLVPIGPSPKWRAVWRTSQLQFCMSSCHCITQRCVQHFYGRSSTWCGDPSGCYDGNVCNNSEATLFPSSVRIAQAYHMCCRLMSCSSKTSATQAHWKVEDPFSLLLMTWRRGEKIKRTEICEFTFASWYLLAHSNFVIPCQV